MAPADPPRCPRDRVDPNPSEVYMSECVHCGSTPDDDLPREGEFRLETALWQTVLEGMRDYRECGDGEYLRQAYRALDTWLHFEKLCKADLNPTP